MYDSDAERQGEPLIGVGLYEDHNSGIAAIQNGRILAYAEWERFTRKKNQSGWHPELLVEFLRRLPLDHIGAICAPRPSAIAALLVEYFGAEYAYSTSVDFRGHKIELIGQDDLHPYLHMLSMLIMSGIKPALYAVLIADAEQSRVGWVDLRFPLQSLPEMHLLPPSPDRWFCGAIFSSLFGKMFYGNDRLENCGKLMGLASWGRVRLEYVDFLSQTAQSTFNPDRYTWQGYDDVTNDVLQSAATSYLNVSPLAHESPDVQDLAASAQELFRHHLVAKTVSDLELLRINLLKSGLPEPVGMIYSGGCGLSVVTNRALRRALDIPLIAAPYTHDSAQFVGAAVYSAIVSSSVPFILGEGWMGIPDHTTNDLSPADFCDAGLEHTLATPTEIARLLAQGRLLGRVKGGAEAGPRALGHRSLLASPLKPGIHDELNFRVKKREWYRPFAPMVLAERFFEYFGEPASPCSSYMLDAFSFLPAYRGTMSAVASPDGLSRPQAVDHQDPWLRELICETGKHTGVDMVLNTSLNAPGKTIAYDASQVLADFEVLGLDGLVCESSLFSRASLSGGVRKP